MKHTKCYIEGYPRTQFVRNSYELLNGEWNFVKDYANEGLVKKYFEKFPAAQKIVVPFAYQSESSACEDKRYCKVVWYNRSCSFVKQTAKGLRTILIFEGADYSTSVWVNGVFVGHNEGGYHRFEFDITDCLNEGKADIVVRIEDTYDVFQPRGKQKWKDKHFGCWYMETTGIWKTVWAEFVAPTRLQSASIKSNYHDSSITLDYRIVGQIEQGLSLETLITFDGMIIAKDIVALQRNIFSRTISLIGENEPFKTCTWSENSPNLYDVQYTLRSNGETLDCVGSYFGFREFYADGDLITINDWPLYLRMTLDQGYFAGGGLTPTEEQIVKDIELTKAMGLNGIRKHQKIEDDRFYYYCDVMGVYVWLEMPSAYEYNDTMTQAFIDQWTKIVKQHYNHPSIMAYVPINESWGVPRIAANKSQQCFSEALYYLTKSLTNEFVVSNDGWEHTKSDLITLHHYEQDGSKLASAFENIEGFLQDQKGALLPARRVFARGYKYEGQPVILSEFAGIAFEKDSTGDNWGYGTSVKSTAEFLKRLESQLKAVYGCDKLSGFCLTQTTDVEQEVNGLLDFNRCPKAPLKDYKRIFTNDKN